MPTLPITINSNGGVNTEDAHLHKNSANGSNAVQWQSGAGTHTVTNLPAGVFSPTPPATITVSPGNPSATYTVLSSATDGDYTYKVDDGVVRAEVSSGVGKGSSPSITVQP